MVINRKTSQHILTQFLHKIEAGQRAVTAGGANKTDIFIGNPRFGQFLQNMGDKIKSTGNPRHIVKKDDDLLFAFGQFFERF